MAAALAAKNKGNEAFKLKQYELAIAHYTTALQIDPSEAAFFLNRALCYLRLEKWTNAERDSETALSLEPGNAKALFRRGLARKGNGKVAEARKDFLEAKKAGAGAEVDKELESLGAEPATSASAPPSADPATGPTTSVSSPISAGQASRLKAAITPETSAREPESNEFMRAVSTKRTSTPPAAPSSFAAQKEQRATRFSTVPRPPPATPPAVPSSPPVVISPLPVGTSSPPAEPKIAVPPRTSQLFTPLSTSLSPPPNGAAFELAWSTYPSPASRMSLLQSYDPTSLPNLFQASLTPDLISEIIFAISSSPVKVEWLLPFLKGLAGVNRFQTLVGFLEETEKKALKGLFEILRKDIETLAKTWEVE